MAGNTFGTLFRLTTFGESHGEAIGGIIDGCPANININLEEIQKEIDRRKPGQSDITTPRIEDDKVEILSGIFNDTTLGTPIGFIIRNKDQKSADYNNLKDTYRPSHADYTYEAKYGIRDYRGGGRSSARETACRVVAGAIAKQILIKLTISIQAYVKSIGTIKCELPYTQLNLSQTEKNIVRCPDLSVAEKMIKAIEEAKKEGDTLGGVITCVIKGTPTGLGEPVFDKLHAELAKAMLSINAVKGFELGSGFEGTKTKGSQHNDAFTKEGNKVITKTNNSGGIQGGLSNGEDIYFNVAFKPIASIRKEQDTINIEGENKKIIIEGRHDPCVLPRAVPIVEAMAAITVLDFYLRNKAATL